jgi:hypothetical protein
MKNLKSLFSDLLSEYGFTDSSDLLHHIFGYQNTFVFKVQVLLAFAGTFAVTATRFIETWLWEPAIGLLVISVMIFLRSISGAAVKIKVEKKPFNLNKSLKTLPILLAHVGFMSLSWHIAKAEVIMTWLPSAVFVVFATYHLLLLGKDLVKLELIEGELLTKLAGKIEDNTK